MTMTLLAETAQTAQNWQTAAVVTLGGIVTMVLGTKLGRVEKQVANKHDTNLRDDLTDVKNLIEGQAVDIRGIRKDVGGIRGELRDERAERIELAKKVERIVDKRSD